MKIIQVLNHFLPDQTAGTEVYTWALSKELKHKGIDVKVVIPNYGDSHDNEYIYDGLRVYQFAEPTIVDRSLIMGFREPDGLSSFIAYLKKEKPHIVHFHELVGSNGIGLAHVRAAKKCGAKVIMTLHLAGYTCSTGTLMYKGTIPCDGKISDFKCSTCYLHNKGLKNTSYLLAGASIILNRLNIDPSKWGNPIGTGLGIANLTVRLRNNLNELIELCDQIVCISKWYQKVLFLNNIDTRKITFIGQGLPIQNTSFFVNIEKSSCLRLMFLGRITPIKGLHLLIDALAFFKETEFELSIFGNSDGTNYESSLREKTKDKSNINWRGSLSQDKVQEQMRAHDLLCLCSTVCEMSPLVIQEAREAELAVLVSNVYGNKEQLNEGATGLLFEINNIESLKNQLSKLVENRNLLNEMKSKILSPRNFTLVGDEYIKLYEKTNEQ
jgi:glycosyltransferase involved in cell wall biosynthesis